MPPTFRALSAPLLFSGLLACASACRSEPAPATASSAATSAPPAAADDLALRKASLTPEQRDVTQNAGTEPAFHNAYWDNHAAGIYVDVVSGEPLFSSREKFESGTGWPSFWAPLDKDNVRTREDRSLFIGDRTEVRSARADSHLGHVFDDGPKPTGLRYCINSASLRFIPADRLAAEGYGQYAGLFPDVAQAAK